MFLGQTPSDILVIPEKLKVPIMEYLDKYHGVNAATVFNDIHGFIRYRAAHRSAYVEFYIALTYAEKREFGRAIEHNTNAIGLNPQLHWAYINRSLSFWRLGNYNSAIQDATRAIELAPNYAHGYQSRGVAYWHQGNYNRAIQDFNKVIEIEPNNTFAYFNRGLSMLSTEDWGKAVLDLSHAQSLGLNIVSTFRDEFRSVVEFEKNYSIQLPENIKEMLTPKP